MLVLIWLPIKSSLHLSWFMSSILPPSNMFRHYLVMAPGEGRAQISLLYDHGEKLSFLQIYLDKVKSLHPTLFAMAGSEIQTIKETRTSAIALKGKVISMKRCTPAWNAQHSMTLNSSGTALAYTRVTT